MLATFNKHVNGLKIGLTAEVTSHAGVERLELNDDAIDASEPISST
ncbi:MAG TPA: hypothetical protein VGO80_20095 [Solirubrobacteraceae bacterium]|jgi:hypothetical protein|nr:hypothetical protein [Solirubrobacteraceae bacterium]